MRGVIDIDHHIHCDDPVQLGVGDGKRLRRQVVKFEAVTQAQAHGLGFCMRAFNEVFIHIKRMDASIGYKFSQQFAGWKAGTTSKIVDNLARFNIGRRKQSLKSGNPLKYLFEAVEPVFFNLNPMALIIGFEAHQFFPGTVYGRSDCERRRLRNFDRIFIKHAKFVLSSKAKPISGQPSGPSFDACASSLVMERAPELLPRSFSLE